MSSLSSRFLFPGWRNLLNSNSRGLRTRFKDFSPSTKSEIIEDGAVENLRKETISKVNCQISSGNHGRLFAVISLRGHQHKLTEEDLLMVQGDLGASVGRSITLDKILFVGGKDFSLIGRPLLPRDLVKVEATIVEKAPSETKIRQSFIRRQNHKHYRVIKNIHTTLRINRICFLNLVEGTNEIAGFDGNNPLYPNSD